MLNEHEYGEVEDVHAVPGAGVIHDPVEVSLYWYATEAMPPPSAGVEVSVIVPSTHAGSAPIVTVGLVLSIRRENTAVDAPLLPRVSVATTRKS